MGGERQPGPPARFQAQRLGVVMRSDPARAAESGGVLNPGAARGRDGQLYLFPRCVGPGNYSRVGTARVRFDDRGRPAGVERLGYAVEPEELYELGPENGVGGCEDPRVTYVAPLDLYVMAYAARGPRGARVALAVSHDLFTWRKLGLVEFLSDALLGVDFGGYKNKDAAFFPEAVAGPDGRPALAMLHRPMYDKASRPRGVDDARPAIWMSYCPLDDVQRDVQNLRMLCHHRLLIGPRYEWERSRIGGGAPPLRIPSGWLLIYHGAATSAPQSGAQQRKIYSAGALLLDADDPRRVLYRSVAPILRPETPEEMDEAGAGIVFPSGVDSRPDGSIVVYYGMANKRVGAAQVILPGAP